MADNQNPILNGPYSEPKFHYRTLAGGALDYTAIEKGRRPFDANINSPIPVGQGPQLQLLDHQQSNAQQIENHLINLIRKEVKAWRESQYENHAPTRVTKELLAFWFNNPDRHAVKKLFFAQQEAIETAIWLNEIAKKTGAGKNILNQLQAARMVSDDRPEVNLPRIAFKMATGTGKTVVMAMLMLYHYFNRTEYRNDPRFADFFLLVAPGITIKDRLSVLNVDTSGGNRNELRDYYHERGLVPPHLEDRLQGINAKIIITNYHAFELRNLQGNKRSPMDGKIGADGQKQEAKEDAALMLRRVLGKFRKDARMLVLNDEAHHCYYPKPKSGRKTAEADDNVKEENERASVWLNGIAEIGKHFRITAVYDLSATPYYLSGSGYEPYTLFPWVVSDFGLIEAIEAGLVKIPYIPESDSSHAIDMPMLRNLYDHVAQDLPKKGRSKQEFFGEPQLPHLIKNALDQFYSDYKKEYERVGSLFDTPPVFIIVCNNTNVSSEVYKYIAGYEQKNEKGEITGIRPGHFDLFTNFDRNTQQQLDKPPTLLIDSAAIEEAGQIDAEFKAIFAPEIERFKQEFRIAYPDKSVDQIDDSTILREVLNTVGKKGKLGQHIRCVVSVNMLTEGWDANTVTHIMGIRKFGSQLLCEQVAGRALRRQSYFLDKSGKFPPEYARIIGVPFQMFKSGTAVAPPPPQQFTRIHALPERSAFEIRFPNLISYRIESVEKEVVADFSKVSPYELDGTRYPETTELGSAFSGDRQVMSLEQVKHRRRQELVYNITRYLINHYWKDETGEAQFYKFNQLRNIVDYWLAHKVKCVGGAFENMLFYENPKSVCDHIMLGIYAEQRRHDKILPVYNHYNREGSTKYAQGITTRKVYPTKHSHVNAVVADTDSWEQLAAKMLEELVADKHILFYVKNAFLGFRVPYTWMGKDRWYEPDFIARARTASGETVNLVIEISGMSKGPDKEAKDFYMRNRWLPAVNNVRHKHEMDAWHFINIGLHSDFRDMKKDLVDFLKNPPPVVTVPLQALFESDFELNEQA